MITQSAACYNNQSLKRDILEKMENLDQSSFSIIALLDNLLKNWWKISLLAVLFGMFALAYSTNNRPKYEAEAVFFARVDESDFNFQNLVDLVGSPVTFSQYDRDLALNVVEKIILQVRNLAFNHAKTLDPTLSFEEFSANTFVERIQGEWFLRYRHQDPAIAQEIVNHWAALVMTQFKQDQEAARIEPFVRLELISTAERPNFPIYQNRRNLLIAGITMGFATGILLVDVKYRFFSAKTKGTR